MNFLTGIGAATLCALAIAPGAHGVAPQYPTKPVRIIVGYPPGSAVDVASRRVAAKIATIMGATFYVENKPGVSASIAAAAAAVAPPDGYTLFAGTTSEMAINRPGGLKIHYDPAADFLPIAFLFSTSPVLLTSTSLQSKTITELVKSSGPQSDGVNWATVNALQQVVVGTVRQKLGIRFNEIPYKGTALAMSDLMGQHIDGMVGYPAEAGVQVNAGKARAIAILGKSRNPYIPDTPTLTELGYPDLELTAWGGLFAPKGTPSTIVEHINAAVVEASKDPEVRAAVAKTGAEMYPYSVDEFSRFVKSEISKWERLVKETAVQITN